MCLGGGWYVCPFDAATFFSTGRLRATTSPHTLFGTRTLSVDDGMVMEPAFSSAVIRDPAGKQVDRADTHVDTADRTVVRVSLPPLDPGIYIVEWRAMPSDTHKINGNFRFWVGE